MSAQTQLAERFGHAAALAARARQEADEALHAAQAAGLSQREIARIVGRSQPEVRRRLLRQRPARNWPTAAEYGRGIATELDAGDTDFAFRLVQQALATLAELNADDLTDFLSEKPLTGDVRYDTLLQGAISSAAARRGLTLRWSPPPPLDREWFIVPDDLLRERTRRLADRELAALNVWIDANSLRTA